MKQKQREQRKLIDQLKTLRDRARLKIHLASMDAKDEFKKLDQRVNELERSLEPAREVAKESAQDILDATEVLIDQVEKGFTRLLESLTAEEYKDKV